MKNVDLKYPGIDDAEREKGKGMACIEEQPDFIGMAPNYDKFRGWSPEQVMAFLNID